MYIEEASSDGVTETCYEYDGVNRLVSEEIKDENGKITYLYKYDKVGNRLSKRTNVKGDIEGIVDSDAIIKEGIIKYSYNSNNQLLKEEYGSEVKAYYYDTNGNLTAIVNGSDVQKYEYNKQNKLVKFTDAQGNQTTYTYDGEGNRISKKGEDYCTEYVVTTFNELSYTLLELDGDSNLTKYYTIGTDIISQDNKENDDYYILDAHGSVLFLTNASGNVVNKYRYDSFGNILSHIEKIDNSYYYNCENYDKQSGLYYLRARYLNPQTGTFTQEDTYQGNIYDAVSLHKYLFAASNPVVYEDPTGNSFSFAECSIATSINSILNGAYGFLNTVKNLKFVDKATVVVNTVNIATAMLKISCGEPIEDAIYDAFNIAMSIVVIGTTIWTPPYLVSIGIGAFGITKDTYDIFKALINRDWCGVVSGIGSMVIDAISMGTQINEHNWGLLLEESKFVRNGDQKALINIVKEAVMEGGATENVKDILFDWAKEYDSFEDVWNLIYHLKG